MAKKSKTIQMPSPENYIRTRARSLQIHECMVNSHWKEEGMANVVVSRKHTNGNITFGVFLVDLYCLGLKDSMYMFNVSKEYFHEKKEEMGGDAKFIPIDYTLAHNIIYAGIEFAGDHGFNPDKSFSSVTKYLLEEDTEDIEMIDIECGLNGKPFYLQGPSDDMATINRILKQLDRTAGKGNYNYSLVSGIHHHDMDFDEEDEAYDESEDEDDMDAYSLQEAINTFRKYEYQYETLNDEEYELFEDAVFEIFDTITDADKQQEYYEQFMDDLDVDVISEDIPDETLGLPEQETGRKDVLKRTLLAFMAMPERKNKKAEQMLEELKADFDNNPFIAFLELFFQTENGSALYEERLNRYSLQFPDYPLIQISELSRNHLNVTGPRVRAEVLSLHSLFPGRESVYILEMQVYLLYALIAIIAKSDHAMLSGFEDAISDTGLSAEISGLVLPVIISTKVHIVHLLLEKASEEE